ncbi:MAG: hypothetical protein E7661_02375 [Ruminococcaceae bacterium]|nr:hypothetical protein [Oscillospiraceae bacterium]
MLFDKKRKLLKKPNKEAEQELRNQIEAEGGLEKNDIPAMVLSAFLVIVPAVLGALLVVVLLCFLFFM